MTRNLPFIVFGIIMITCALLLQNAEACLLCPSRDTGASMYTGNAVMRIRAGRKQLSPQEEQLFLVKCVQQYASAVEESATPMPNVEQTPTLTKEQQMCRHQIMCACRLKCGEYTMNNNNNNNDNVNGQVAGTVRANAYITDTPRLAVTGCVARCVADQTPQLCD